MLLAATGRKALHPLLSQTNILGLHRYFMLGSLLCGVAISSNMFIIGRAVAGAGASGIYSGCLSIIAVVIPLSKRALYNGILGSLFGVATVAGPLIGGVLTTKASWRWCFNTNTPVGAITVASLILLFNHQSGNRKAS
jgi:MFS family permease